MFRRHIKTFLTQAMQHYPAVTLTGPRQSGKTTLLRNSFPDFKYVLLENNDVREFANEDPHGFLEQYNQKVIFDEIQNVPKLLSYLQGVIDSDSSNGRFILSGSQQLLLNQNISQSLAGRTALLRLLPLTLSELLSQPAQTYWQDHNLRSDSIIPNKNLYDYLLSGMYPRLHNNDIEPFKFYRDYVETYVTRDLKSLLNVGDLNLFTKFLRLCAGRTGQICNFSSLADDAGVDHTTASRWISVLEASYIIKLLEPHHVNFNKRLVKSPKLYFLDTGLLCYLLKIRNTKDLASHPLIGNIFENFAFTEIYKTFLNADEEAALYFWQDYRKKEIDFMIDYGQSLFPIEVKAGKTITKSYFNNLNYWLNMEQNPQTSGSLIYAGNETIIRNNIQIIPWFCIS